MLALLIARCLSWQEVAHSLSVKVVLLVAASLALGDALDLSGATAVLAAAAGHADRAGSERPGCWRC